jgi:site-specific recombinase XerC
MDLRDQAILAVMSQRVMPLGALVNVRVADFNSSNGTLAVVVRKGAAPMKIKLNSSAKNAIINYMALAGLGRDATSPLFLKTDKRTKLLDASHAACSRDLRSVVTQRARRAKIPAAGLFVRVR